jgi:hypothetical protein
MESFLIDHRLALVALAALLVAAGAPLAWGWAKLLPEEPPPFEVQSGALPIDAESAANGKPARRDPFAVFLLACATVSYLIKFPGLPVATGLHWLSTQLPADYFNWTVLAGRGFFLVVPGLAAAYSALRPNPIRIALILGGVLVLALWLASPFLLASLHG